MDMEAVCQRLDLLVVELLELMQQQLQVKSQLTGCMKDGFLNLAKARYVSGNASISALQLPAEDQEVSAQATVRLEEGHLRLAGPPVVSPGSKRPPEGDMEELVKPADPLQWFGVLVPRNLRQAQSSFRSALEWAVDSANVQLQLQRCQDEYARLLELKAELLSVH